MDAFLYGEVDLSGTGTGERDGGFEEWLLSSNEGEYTPVVIGVGVEVEDANVGDGPDGIGYSGNLFGVAALAEVRDGLEELGRHGALSPSESPGRGRG